MEWTCKRKFKKNTVGILIIFFFLSIYIFPQEINLYEEKIFEKDLSIKKTEIQIFTFPQISISFPDVPLIHLEDSYEEEKNYIDIKAGSFSSFYTDLFSKWEKNFSQYLFNFKTGYSNGYRENDMINETYLEFGIKTEKPFLNFTTNFLNKNIELPGPTFSPFSSTRNSENSNVSIQYKPDKEPFLFEISNKSYKTENFSSNYITLGCIIEKENINIKNYFERQDFWEYFCNNSISSGIFYKNGNICFGGNVKGITEYGERFLPYCDISFLEGFKFKIDGKYEIPNFWYDFQNINYKELKPEKIPPSESYSATISYQKEIKKSFLKFDISEIWWKNFYIWKDNDSNFLLEPFSEKDLWETFFNLEFNQKIKPISYFFIRFNKDFFQRDIDYIPESNLETGFGFKNDNSEGKVWFSYTGEKVFSPVTIEEYLLCNCEFLWGVKKNIRLGFDVYNIFNQEYEYAPGYPGEKRKILLYTKIYF